jgi:hypothetical protein
MKCTKCETEMNVKDYKDVKIDKCPNCNETEQPCACIRNKCIRCGNTVGNITFTVCDECWDKD